MERVLLNAMNQENSRDATIDAELTEDEKVLVLKALAYYQVHLFDELSKKTDFDGALSSEYKKITIMIKKIHKTMEKANLKSSYA